MLVIVSPRVPYVPNWGYVPGADRERRAKIEDVTMLLGDTAPASTGGVVSCRDKAESIERES